MPCTDIPFSFCWPCFPCLSHHSKRTEINNKQSEIRIEQMNSKYGEVLCPNRILAKKFIKEMNKFCGSDAVESLLLSQEKKTEKWMYWQKPETEQFECSNMPWHKVQCTTVYLSYALTRHQSLCSAHFEMFKKTTWTNVMLNWIDCMRKRQQKKQKRINHLI